MADSINEAEEAEVVKQLRCGDSTAVERLYNAYFDRIYSLVFNRVGGDQHTAEDIVQETFLAALKSAGKFRGQSKLYTWLCSIAYHKLSDFYRRQGREAQHQIQRQGIHTLELDQIQDGEPVAPGPVESEEARQIIEQALLSLPLDYQHVLTFKYIEDMSVREISQIMDRSPKSVEGLLSRARQELRTKLAAPVRDNGR